MKFCGELGSHGCGGIGGGVSVGGGCAHCQRCDQYIDGCNGFKWCSRSLMFQCMECMP